MYLIDDLNKQIEASTRKDNSDSSGFYIDENGYQYRDLKIRQKDNGGYDSWAHCCAWISKISNNKNYKWERDEKFCSKKNYYANKYKEYSSNFDREKLTVSKMYGFSKLDAIYLSARTLENQFRTAIDCGYDYLILTIGGFGRGEIYVSHNLTIKLKHGCNLNLFKRSSKCLSFDPDYGQQSFETLKKLSHDIYGKISAFYRTWKRVDSVKIMAMSKKMALEL